MKDDYSVAFHVLQEWHDITAENQPKLHYSKRNSALAYINSVKQTLFHLLKA